VTSRLSRSHLALTCFALLCIAFLFHAPFCCGVRASRVCTSRRRCSTLYRSLPCCQIAQADTYVLQVSAEVRSGQRLAFMLQTTGIEFNTSSAVRTTAGRHRAGLEILLARRQQICLITARPNRRSRAFSFFSSSSSSFIAMRRRRRGGGSRGKGGVELAPEHGRHERVPLGHGRRHWRHVRRICGVTVSDRGAECNVPEMVLKK